MISRNFTFNIAVPRCLCDSTPRSFACKNTAISDTFEKNNVSFGSTNRSGALSNRVDYEFSTMSRMFRDDLNWLDFAKFLGENFKDKEKVNVINHACSDGSEPYTLAISLIEMLGEKGASKFFPIEARDIERGNLMAAESGLINFNECDLEDFKKNNIDIDKYFVKSDKKLVINGGTYFHDVDDLADLTQTYEVKPELRKLVNFRYGNIINDARTLKDDSDTVLLCRHVLPHIGAYDGPQTLEEIVKHLKKGSVVSLGGQIHRSTLSSYTKSYEKIMEENGFLFYNDSYKAKLSKTYVKTN